MKKRLYIVEPGQGQAGEGLFERWQSLLRGAGHQGPVVITDPASRQERSLGGDCRVWPSTGDDFSHVKDGWARFEAEEVVRIASRVENLIPEFLEELLETHGSGRAECTYGTMAELNVPGVLVEVFGPQAVRKLDHHSPRELYGGRVSSIEGVGRQQHRPSVSIWRHFCRTRFEEFFDLPVLINLETARNCVCGCSMCLTHSASARPYNRKYPPLMKWGLFRKVVDEIAGRAYRPPTIVNLFLAGEPLLNRSLEEMTRYCAERGMLVFVSTNAVLLDEKRARGLLEAGIRGVYCSVDGATRETFAKIRQGADFETVVGNINRLIEIKNELGLNQVQVGMKYVLQEANRHETGAFLDYWIPKAHNVAFQSMVARRHPWESGGSVARTYYDSDKRRRPCCAPFMGMSVAADGKVLPCVLTNFQKEDEIMGDLAVSSVEEIWHSEKYERIRALHLSEDWSGLGMCSRCDGVLGDNAEIQVDHQDGGLVRIVTPGAITYKHR